MDKMVEIGKTLIYSYMGIRALNGRVGIRVKIVESRGGVLLPLVSL